MMFEKLSIGLWVLDASGYWADNPGGTLDKLRAALAIQNLKGVELIYPTHVNENNYRDVKDFCMRHSLTVISVNPNIWADKDFEFGAFTSPNAAARAKAIEYGKRAYDMAKELGAGQMCLWPGQDGFDYPFQNDYAELWQRETAGIAEIARYAEGLRIGIEYKAREPRSHILLDSAGTALMFARQLPVDNVGIYLDFGHALLARENPGATVVKAMQANKLYGIHINDNYGFSDEDMTFISIHHIETLEFLFYIQKMNYDGWISLDIAPRKEDPIAACNLCFENLMYMNRALERIDRQKLQEAQKNSDALKAQRLINQALIGSNAQQ
jgi:L-rhamnose isomerase